ncbi:MAG: methanogenesis marker 2 protein [Candidatus Velthaea sp.]
MSLAALTATLAASKGIAHKRDIRQAFAALREMPDLTNARVGDDCAAIPDGDGFLLFAIEGLLEEFVAVEPWFAGYCAVMVNVSDVFAMGGRPVALVDALWSCDGTTAAHMWAGMQAAARAYAVPIIGGHTNVRSAHAYLAAAILGRASRLLSSFDAQPDDVLLAAIDLRGDFFRGYDYWNCSTDAPPDRLRGDLDVLVGIAESGLCDAAKDISMGGIVGTALMLLECSGVGAHIQLDRIPRPAGVPIDRWVRSFPSFGFLLSVAPESVGAVRAQFAQRDIACAPIGSCTSDRRVTLGLDGETTLFWDLTTTPLMGAHADAAVAGRS